MDDFDTDGLIGGDSDLWDEGDMEPDLDFQFEHDSAMTSIGWGTDEDYGYFGGDEG